MAPRQVRRFAIFYTEKAMQAYRPELWYAAKIVTSNFDDSNFFVLACFLVLSGRKTFEAVLVSPELLGKLTLPKGVPLEIVRDFPREIYFQQTGQKLKLPRWLENSRADVKVRFQEFVRQLPELKASPPFQQLKTQFWKPEIAEKNQVETVLKFLPIHERFAEDGHAPSQMYLGCLYWLGKSVPKNMDKAVRYFRSAAYQNVPLAQACLGAIYFQGDGVALDYRTAADWYRQAADQGDPHAQRELGQLYRRGQGVHRDYALAIKWFQAAGEGGDQDGFNDLGLLYLNGEGVEKDYAAAIGWFERSAAMDYPQAVHNLGVVYERADFSGRSEAKAFEYYSAAAGKGHGASLHNLGLWHQKGRLVQQDYRRARELYLQAAALGTTSSLTNLGGHLSKRTRGGARLHESEGILRARCCAGEQNGTE